MKRRQHRRAPMFVWLRCAGPVRVLRVRPGDTLIVSIPAHVGHAQAADIARRLEDTVGLGNDVIVIDADIGLTTLRQGALS